MKKTLLVILVGLVGYIFFLYKQRPTTITPYPYTIDSSTDQKLQLANKANILLVGDRMAMRLERYLPNLTEATSKNLKMPLNIVNWSSEHEGLHRTLHKIKLLNQKPGLIIYHGSTEEFYEKRFFVQDKAAINKNFDLYHDERVLSLLMTFPVLSKFIYRGVNTYRLKDQIKANSTEYPAPEKQSQMEIAFKLYQHELNDLIEYCKERGIPLLIITSPLNLSIGPKKVCTNSISATLLKEQEEISAYLAAGESKTAYAKAKVLLETAPGNAQNHFLMGKIAETLGRTSEARAHLENSTAFDCESWRGNVVFNNMLRKAAEKNELGLIDFDDMVNQNFGQNILFMDEVYPQELFYELLIQQLQRFIIKTLKV